MTDAKSLNEKGRPDPVTRQTLIADVLDSRPDAGRVLREQFKLPCEECVVAEKESIEEGALYYALDPDAIVAALNKCPLAPPEDPAAGADPAAGSDGAAATPPERERAG